MSDIICLLSEIVGPRFVSNQPEELYFYGRDSGLMPAHKPKCVILPKNAEEIQEIVRLAVSEKISVVPMGAGMSLSGLVIPLQGGIVIDMKRMNRMP